MESHNNNKTIRYGFIGASGTGKTTMMVNLVKERIKERKIKVIYYFTKTGLNFDGISESKKLTINNFGSNLEALTVLLQIHNRTQQPGIIIFDDFIDPKISDSKEIAMAFGSARHGNLDIYFTAQSATRVVSTMMKSNMTHITIFRNAPSNVKSLFGDLIQPADPDNEDDEYEIWKSHVYAGNHNKVTYDIQKNNFIIH